ncbi:hypothetical protein V1527DRAFT_450783 [Lipomyces starkeyi]
MSLDSVTEYTNEFGLEMGWLDHQFMFRLDEQYGDEAEALMDERIDLGDVSVPRMQSVASTIRSYIRVRRGVTTRDSDKLDGKSPLTPTGVIKRMTPLMNLVALLDFVCARRGNDGDDRFWKRRKLSKAFSPSHQQKR